MFKEISRTDSVPLRLLEEVRAVRAYLPSFLRIGRQRTIAHYDASGFLDIPGFWADYARELSFMEMFGLAYEAFYAQYFREYPKDPEFEVRKAIYNLKMNLKHISMYPQEAYYRRGAETCLRLIQRKI